MTKSFTEPYRFNAVHRVHLPSGWPEAQNESLPDLSSQESRLLAILHAAADLSHGSEELLGFISDDFTRRQLSPERPNFLHPFRDLLRGRVLVIGFSIGPVVRFVAEHGAEVHVVEPDFGHAALAAARCRDLNNVHSYVGDYASALPDTRPYDLIIATESGNPSSTVQSCLGRLRSILAANGVLIIAVKNSLGMSTLAEGGAFGSAVSDGRWSLASLEVDEVFAAVGFQDVRMYYAFPSPHFCRLIIGAELSVELPAGMEAILSAYDGCDPSANGRLRQQSWKSVLQNGLLKQFSNSFVIAASLKSLPRTNGTDELGIYSSVRRRHFAKATVIYRQNGQLIVSRRPLFLNAAPPTGSLFHLRTYDEPYFAGTPYLDGLQEILDRERWQPKDVAAWARPWLDLLNVQATAITLQSYIGGITHLSVLPPIYVDCIPNNIQVGENGALFPIDFEYEAVAPIPLRFVIYRGLHYALAAVTSTTPPEPIHANISELTVEVMRLAGIPLSADEVQNYNRLEAALQHTVAGAPLAQSEVGLRSAMLRARGFNIPPSPETAGDALQVFWKTLDSQYDESASSAAAIIPGRDRQLISVVIPPLDPPPDVLRLDPCTRTGVFYLFSLQLFDSLGQCIWAWNGDRARFVSKRFLVFADIPFQNGAIAYSEGTDPSLEMPVHSDVLRQLSGGGRLDVEMSWPETPDNIMINQRILNSKGYSDQVLSLEAESRASAQSRDALIALHDDLRNRCDTIEGVLSQIRDQNAALRETHLRLKTGLSECGVKQDRLEREHNTLQSRYEGVERMLAQMQDQNAALTETCQHLSIGLSECGIKQNRFEQQQSPIQQETLRLAAEIKSLRDSVDPALASSVTLNGELQKQLHILKEELKNVSAARSTLQTQNSTLEAQFRASIDLGAQMSSRINQIDQQITVLSQSRSAGIDFEAQLSSRINQLDRQMTALFQGRIWRTLVVLGSPFKILIRR